MYVGAGKIKLLHSVADPGDLTDHVPPSSLAIDCASTRYWEKYKLVPPIAEYLDHPLSAVSTLLYFLSAYFFEDFALVPDPYSLHLSLSLSVYLVLSAYLCVCRCVSALFSSCVYLVSLKRCL